MIKYNAAGGWGDVTYASLHIQLVFTPGSVVVLINPLYVTGFAKMCIVHTKILIRFFDPAYSYTQ